MPENPTARQLLFEAVDGFSRDDKEAWRRFWTRIREMEPGEMMTIDVRMPRSGPYHRRHMKIEQAVFDSQDRFRNFEQFRYWLKVGAGWVDWLPGPTGGVVPVPKSISYAAADQEEFIRYHRAVVAFLREGHAALFFWKHLGDRAHEMMDGLLRGFDE